MPSKTIKWLGLILGCFLSMFGVLGVGLGILDILDPVGTKMADDSDPFGTPHTLTESLTFTAVFATVLLSGVLLMIVSYRHKEKLK
jgi:hypothetical protein